MNSLESILGMIATEAIEGDFRNPNLPERKTMSWQQHPDENVQRAIISLCDALCSWERSTGRQSMLIVRENNGELPGDRMSRAGISVPRRLGKATGQRPR